MIERERIYVCHTFYHAYISCLKELWSGRPESGQASIVLSKMSNDFGNLKERLEQSGLFAEVLEYDEKPPEFFPELDKYRRDRHNILLNMLNRIIYTKKFAKAQIPYLPTDFRQYRDIYVFCDSDPIGYYLNYAKIPYHAMEDGLDSLKHFHHARYDNRGFFGFKAWMSARGLIFIQDGYGKYCLDMEVNDISAIKYHCPKYIERPREELVNGLDDEAKETLLAIFVPDLPALRQKLASGAQDAPRVLVLSEPLCDMETRKRIFTDIIDQYGQVNGKPAQVLIKQHPRDTLDYHQHFPEHIIVDAQVPMEMLNYIPGVFFDRVVSVLTVTNAIKFAGEIVFLSRDFMDKYEDPLIHRQNEQI
jgi:hypothetical protein